MKTCTLHCRCGLTEMHVAGAPILSCECACQSCRAAAAFVAGLPGGVDPSGPRDTTHFVLCRKDRVACVRGMETLAEYRLTASANTRRAVATCCSTPMFLEFKGGHWLSIYAGLWPQRVRPAPQMRTMVRDLPAGESLPDDLPNSQTQSLRFMAKLLGAWVAMGFRAPAVQYVRGGTLDASPSSGASKHQ